MVIDVGVSFMLTYHWHWLWYCAKIVSFTMGVSNSFYWNSRWTFRSDALGGQQRRALTFMAINIVGLIFTLAIMAVVIYKFGDAHGSLRQAIALLIAQKHPVQKKIWLLA